MISKDKLNKLCKYSFKLKESFIENNKNKYLEYCNHLKFHIGSGRGQNESTINLLFEKLIQLINHEPEKYNVLLIKNKLEEKIIELNNLKNKNKIILLNLDKLEKEIIEYKKIIQTINLKLKNFDENTELNSNNDLIEYKNILEKTLNEFIKKFNLSINQLNENKIMLEQNINKIKNLEKENSELKNKIIEYEIQISNSTKKDLKIKTELTNLFNSRQNDLNEFKSKLSEIFTTIYGESISSNIISNVEQNDKNEESIISTYDKLETKININDKEYTLRELIEILKIINTFESKKLIEKINKLENNDINDLEEIKLKYNEIIKKSADELLKPKPIIPTIPKIPIKQFKPKTQETKIFDYSKIRPNKIN